MNNNTDENGGLERFIERQVEALLFASDSPLTISKMTSLTDSPSQKFVKKAIESLSGFYSDNFRSFEIVEVAGGYQVATLPEYSTVIKRLFKNRRKSRLSKAALETLAIVAYKQPVSRPDIEAIRGVNCDGVLSTLTDRELVTVSGRGDSIGKPFLYSTTKRFLDYLGLKNYRELPAIEEFESELEALDILDTLSENEKSGENSENGQATEEAGIGKIDTEYRDEKED